MLKGLWKGDTSGTGKKRRIKEAGYTDYCGDLWGIDASVDSADRSDEARWIPDGGSEAGWDFPSYDGVCEILHQWDYHRGFGRNTGAWRLESPVKRHRRRTSQIERSFCSFLCLYKEGGEFSPDSRMGVKSRYGEDYSMVISFGCSSCFSTSFGKQSFKTPSVKEALISSWVKSSPT